MSQTKIDVGMIDATSIGDAKLLQGDGAWITPAAAGWTLGTEQAITSGTSVTFGSIPSGTKMIIVMLEAISFTSGVDMDLTIGDAGGLETASYVSTASRVGTTSLTVANSTAEFIIDSAGGGADTVSGHITLTLKDSANFTWICTHMLKSATATTHWGAGDKSLSAELTQLSLSGGTFDGSGSINIMYQ
jgi:hypothetical protein